MKQLGGWEKYRPAYSRKRDQVRVTEKLRNKGRSQKTGKNKLRRDLTPGGRKSFLDHTKRKETSTKRT